jgi:chemotaxis protein CheX
MEQYIQPFIDVTKSAFKDFLGAEVSVGRPFFSRKDTPNECEISGIIGLSGEARGAVVIGMKSALAIRLTDMLTGTAHSAIDDDVVDAIGEIVNIMSGNAKKGLEEAFRLVISLPSIVKGPGHEIKWPHEQARIMCIPCSIFGSDSFTLSVAIESLKGG